MNIQEEEDYVGSYLSIHGKRGPLKQFYQSEIVPDNVTRTDVDMDHLGKFFLFLIFIFKISDFLTFLLCYKKCAPEKKR